MVVVVVVMVVVCDCVWRGVCAIAVFDEFDNGVVSSPVISSFCTIVATTVGGAKWEAVLRLVADVAGGCKQRDHAGEVVAQRTCPARLIDNPRVVRLRDGDVLPSVLPQFPFTDPGKTCTWCAPVFMFVGNAWKGQSSSSRLAMTVGVSLPKFTHAIANASPPNAARREQPRPLQPASTCDESLLTWP